MDADEDAENVVVDDDEDVVDEDNDWMPVFKPLQWDICFIRITDMYVWVML